MKRILFSLLFLTITYTIQAQITDVVWTHQYGSDGSDRGILLANDTEGNTFSVGNFGGAIDFDTGVDEEILTPEIGGDGFLKKNDAEGNLLWIKQFPSPSAAFTVLEIDPDGNLFIAGFYNDSLDVNPADDETSFIYPSVSGFGTFLIKLDASGEFIWANDYTTPSAGLILFESIAFDEDANAIATLSFFGEMNVGSDADPVVVSTSSPGINGILFFKLNTTDGSLAWHRQVGGEGLDYGNIVLDYESNIYLAGYFSDSADFDPSADDYFLYSSGISSAPSAYLAKYSAEGDFIWAKQAEGSDYAEFTHIVVFDEGLYLVGDFSGIIDFDFSDEVMELDSEGDEHGVVMRVDFDGNLNWVKQIETERHPFIYIDTDEYNDIYITGVFRIDVDLDPSESTFTLDAIGPDDFEMPIMQDNYITKWTSEGEFLWGGHFPSTNMAEYIGVHVINATEVYAYGIFTDSIEVNPKLGEEEWFESEGFHDIMLVKLNVLNTVGIFEESPIGNLVIYPNPTTGITQVSLPNSTEIYELAVFNIRGEKVLSKTNLTGGQAEINVGHLANGVYNVLLLNESGNVAHNDKLIIQQ